MINIYVTITIINYFLRQFSELWINYFILEKKNRERDNLASTPGSKTKFSAKIEKYLTSFCVFLAYFNIKKCYVDITSNN